MFLKAVICQGHGVGTRLTLLENEQESARKCRAKQSSKGL